MNNDQLINTKYLILQRQKILRDNNKFIYNEIASRLNNNIDGIKLSLENCLEIGYTSEKICNYILQKFPNINYYIADISKNILSNINKSNNLILLDSDKWNIIDRKFDFIISNLFLNTLKNLNISLKNIYNLLNINGFFIASIPGINFFYELKHCMIEADLKLYGGAYRRFTEPYAINDISNFLKINNFKIPVIEIDTIQLRYKKFSNLLKDVKYMGYSNFNIDRKKTFENKNYFKIVEDFYWNNFSINNEIILQIEVVYFSGWKEK